MTTAPCLTRPTRPTDSRRLRDGSVLRVCELEPGDEGTVLEVFAGLGPRSRELRFMTPKPRLNGPDLRQLTAVDDRDHVALVAVSEEDGPIGIARFVRDPNDAGAADVAVAVVDSWQRRGVGTALADALSRRAREEGIHRFTVVMQRDNTPAMHLLHRARAGVDRLAIDRETAEFSVSLVDRGQAVPRRRATLKGANR
jgi:RimJ/RimL family protein N-acetyltransferase